jgi:hypothetical protein
MTTRRTLVTSCAHGLINDLVAVAFLMLLDAIWPGMPAIVCHPVSVIASVLVVETMRQVYRKARE